MMSSIVERIRRVERGASTAAAGTASVQHGRVRVWRPLVSLLVAGLTAVFLSGSVCIAVYCTEDCDPCIVQNCKCSTCTHTHTSESFEVVHRLEGYDLKLVADSENHLTRIYANIIGLSLDRALGARAHSEDDMAKFARNVLAVNADVLQLSSSSGMWMLDRVERFDGACVVSFHESTGEESSIDADAATAIFLFDGRGNLVEIDHTQR